MTWHLPAPGLQCTYVEESIRRLIQDAENIRGKTGPQDVIARVHDYGRWVEDAERMLAATLDDTSAWQALHTDRYWAIRQLSEPSTRPYPLIFSEIDAQVARLRQIADRLQEYRKLFEVDDATVVLVADTNVYVHYRRFTEIDWCRVADAPAVLLVVPLIVIDELDDLKNRGGKVSTRAGGVIKDMRTVSTNFDAGKRVDLRTATQMQFLVEPPDHVRRTNNDNEIVRQASYLGRLTNGKVAIVTGDGGMQLRAGALDLTQRVMPDEYRLPLGEQ